MTMMKCSGRQIRGLIALTLLVWICVLQIHQTEANDYDMDEDEDEDDDEFDFMSSKVCIFFSTLSALTNNCSLILLSITYSRMK